MDYNNFFTRSLISFIFLSIYFFLSFYNFDYILFFIIFIYVMIFIEIIMNFKRLKIFILIYLIISFLFFLNLEINNVQFMNFNLLILVIISFDIFSYIFGNLYGRTKILFSISPNKTLEGLLGGVVCSFALSLIYLYFFNLHINSKNLIIVLIIIISSFLGDVIESKFKRINNIKNSSNYLPGHGGFFDRFDSFILSIISYSFLINIL